MNPNPDADEGLREPLDAALRRRLRRAVLDHPGRDSRRSHPAVLHAGQPDGPQSCITLDLADDADHGLRTDVVAALLRRAVPPYEDHPAPLFWLSRSGDPSELEDVDARWLSAARDATREAGLPLVFVVVGRSGWHDPRSGVHRSWVRVRPSRPRRSRARV